MNVLGFEGDYTLFIVLIVCYFIRGMVDRVYKFDTNESQWTHTNTSIHKIGS